MPPSATLPVSTRAAVLLALSLGVVGLFGVLGCGARNIVGELPDGGGGARAGAGGGAAGAAGGAAGTGGGVTGAAGGSVACGIPGTSQIPRLTNAQYDRTVRDLLGVTAITAYNGVPPSALLAPDSRAPLVQLGWSGYQVVAEAIAAQVMSDATLRPRFLACTPTGDGTACLHDTIVAFGRRAFRRPLTTAEVARFDKIVAARARITATGAPAEVAEVLLETFLASPSFIQRSEISSSSDGLGHFALTSYEVASRLAYMIWGSAPDDVLDQAANGNALTTRTRVRAEAVRMLADKRARELVADFHRDYRAFTSWPTSAAKDPVRFPAYNATFAADADAELARFFDAIVFDQRGSFQDLLTSPLGFVTRQTAPTYGLDGSRYGAALTQVTLNAAQRPGFLTRLGFLSRFSQSDGTSPTRRGGYVERKVLGVEIPPDVANGDAFPITPTDGFATNRKRVEAATGAEVCAGCHSYVNPPGFVLEAYDGIGAWRTTEADTGAPIDTAAIVRIEGANVPIRDPADLMAMLAAAPGAWRSYAGSLVSYAYERTDALDGCVVDALAANIAQTGYPLLDLIADLTLFDGFMYRAREVTP